MTLRPSFAPTAGAPLREYWEAEACGTHGVDAERFTRDYFDRIEARRYQLEPFIRDFAEFSRWRGQRGLEVGVGAATDFLQFVRAGADMVGVDLTDAAVEHARHRGAVYGFPSLAVHRANAEQLPFAGETFDFVYSWGVIHHSADTWRAFDEIYRVVRPGGTIKIMVYNAGATLAWLKWLHHAAAEGKWGMSPRAGRAWALANYQENGGTKGFTQPEVRRALARYPHTDLVFRYYDDVVQSEDRYALLFRALRAIEPVRMRWFLTFELVKSAA